MRETRGEQQSPQRNASLGTRRRAKRPDRDHGGAASASVVWLACALILIGGLIALLIAMPPAGTSAAKASAATPIAATPVAIRPLIVDGDQVVTLVPVPPDASAIYAAGGEGLYRSVDGGDHWTLAGPPPPPGRIVVAAGDPMLLLAGDHPPCAQGSDRPHRLWRSQDGGASWQADKKLAQARPLAIWGKHDLALAATCANLLLSSDAGLTWKAALPRSALQASAFAPLAGSPTSEPAGLVIFTAEMGESFLSRLDVPDPGSPHLGAPLLTFTGAGVPAGRDNFYVVGAVNGVWTSTDAGVTWQQSRRGLEQVTLSVDPLSAPIPEEELQRGYGIDSVVIDPGDPTRLFAGTIGGVYQSTNGGTTWQWLPGVTGRVTALAVLPATGTLLAETEAGVAIVTLPS